MRMASEFDKSQRLISETLNRIYDVAVARSGDPENPVGALRKQDIPGFLQARHSLKNILAEHFGEKDAQTMAAGYVLSQALTMHEVFGLAPPDMSEFSDGTCVIAHELHARDMKPGKIWDNWNEIGQSAREVHSATMVESFHAGRYSAEDMQPLFDNTDEFPTK